MADFYGLLGVGRDATPEEIKKAYRRAAREHHPDANRGDPEAEARFKEVSVAYEVLSDPESARQMLDMYGDAAVAVPAVVIPSAGPDSATSSTPSSAAGAAPSAGAARVADNGARRARREMPTSNRPSTSSSPRPCSGSREGRHGAHGRGL